MPVANNVIDIGSGTALHVPGTVELATERKLNPIWLQFTAWSPPGVVSSRSTSGLPLRDADAPKSHATMDPVASKVKELTTAVRPGVELDIVKDGVKATLPVVVDVKLQDDAW